MIDVSLESASALVNMLVSPKPEQILLSDEAWKDIAFEAALDSRSVVHVCSMDDVPGYPLAQSPGIDGDKKSSCVMEVSLPTWAKVN